MTALDFCSGNSIIHTSFSFPQARLTLVAQPRESRFNVAIRRSLSLSLGLRLMGSRFRHLGALTILMVFWTVGIWSNRSHNKSMFGGCHTVKLLAFPYRQSLSLRVIHDDAAAICPRDWPKLGSLHRHGNQGLFRTMTENCDKIEIYAAFK